MTNSSIEEIKNNNKEDRDKLAEDLTNTKDSYQEIEKQCQKLEDIRKEQEIQIKDLETEKTKLIEENSEIRKE